MRTRARYDCKITKKIQNEQKKTYFSAEKTLKCCIFRNNVVFLWPIMENKLTQLTPATLEELELPLAEALRAGFPSPAADYAGDRIDITHELVRHPETTFYARIQGASMRDAGIFDGDLVVVDRSIDPRDGDYVAACVDGEFTLKEYRYDAANNMVLLIPHNPEFPVIKVTEEESLIIWGVITYSIHKTH